MTFGNLGIGLATVYYVARGEFRRQEILGNNILLSVGVGAVGVLAGLVVVLFFRETVFPGVSPGYLLLALVLVPVEVFFSYVRYVLLGAQRIKEFNYVQIARSALFLGLIALALLGLRAGVTGAYSPGCSPGWLLTPWCFAWLRQLPGGLISTPNPLYIKRATHVRRPGASCEHPGVPKLSDRHVPCQRVPGAGCCGTVCRGSWARRKTVDDLPTQPALSSFPGCGGD